MRLAICLSISQCVQHVQIVFISNIFLCDNTSVTSDLKMLVCCVKTHFRCNRTYPNLTDWWSCYSSHSGVTKKNSPHPLQRLQNMVIALLPAMLTVNHTMGVGIRAPRPLWAPCVAGSVGALVTPLSAHTHTHHHHHHHHIRLFMQ